MVPLAAAPLLLTAASGSLYSLLLERGIDAFWLLKLHTGKFGPINLQPYYSVLLGMLTLVVIASGLALLLSSGRAHGGHTINGACGHWLFSAERHRHQGLPGDCVLARFAHDKCKCTRSCFPVPASLAPLSQEPLI